ncbi:Sec1 family protein [Tritrichomonas foetus]|uniref:Sec1 family protein n=1 Tax=Tritrichomonas foetus TaxID=1144522 RepID=A0A1J4JDF7_9EUKA|nr:Sec1 family protein [Tritrichomonas foetus]|eukprot:OHS95469.1 Sec1 family protein [Tritrichomonas foetus]
MTQVKKEIGLPFSIFKEQVNNDLKEILRNIPSEKRYITAPKYLINYVARSFDFSSINANLVSIDSIKPSDNQVVLIVVTPSERSNVELVLDKFQLVPNYVKVLLLIPRITALVQQTFENRNLKMVKSPSAFPKTDIIVHEFHADFFPVDEDYFLLPCHKSFFQINAENDFNDLYASARALAKIQTVFGVIPNILTVGNAGERVRDLMRGIMSQAGSLTSQAPQIDSLLIFDRTADIVTPLCSQSTFEGLVDEFFGINFGITSPSEDAEVIFSEKQELIAEMRGQLFEKVHQTIEERVREYGKYEDPEYQEQIRKADIAEFKKLMLHMKYLINEKKFFVKVQNLAEKLVKEATKTPLFVSLRNAELNLLAANSSVMPMAEHFMLLLNDWKTAMRLILLEAAVGHKLRKDLINQELIDQYGESAKNTIKTLDRLHLLSTQQSNYMKQWRSINESLGLVMADDNICKMCDQVVPLSVRLVQKATQGDWPGNWGKIFAKSNMPLSVEGQPPPPVEGKLRRLLIFFIGGVTLSEVAFIRNLGKEIFDGKIQYVIGSTDQINADSFTEQLCPGLFDA